MPKGGLHRLLDGGAVHWIWMLSARRTIQTPIEPKILNPRRSHDRRIALHIWLQSLQKSGRRDAKQLSESGHKIVCVHRREQVVELHRVAIAYGGTRVAQISLALVNKLGIQDRSIVRGQTQR